MRQPRHSTLWWKSIREARGFVEETFGRGSGSAKFTQKRSTLYRAIRRDKALEGEDFTVQDFEKHLPEILAQVWILGKKPREALVYFRKGIWKTSIPIDQKASLVHEIAHAAFERKKGVPIYRKQAAISEAAAYTVTLDYLLQESKKEFYSRMADFSRFQQNPHLKDPNRVGAALAFEIFRLFPQREQRKQVLNALLNYEYTSYPNALEWLKRFRKKAVSASLTGKVVRKSI
ncbi:MAG: hypothetical protein V1847_03240 [Candidatus Diapherotrites archaeon]